VIWEERKGEVTHERMVFPDPAAKPDLSSSVVDKGSAYVYRGSRGENQSPFSIVGMCSRG